MAFFKDLRTLVLAVSTVAVAVFSLPTSVAEEAESADVKIARAMLAAPENISADATILDVDGTVLREGNNGWSCFPGVGLIPGDKHPMCADAVWMKWMGTAGVGEPFETDELGYSYMLAGDAMVNNDDPTATDPNDGGVWVQEGPHLMLLMPTSMPLEHLNHDPYAGGPYVMWGGTPLQHIMVPVGGEIPE